MTEYTRRSCEQYAEGSRLDAEIEHRAKVEGTPSGLALAEAETRLEGACKARDEAQRQLWQVEVPLTAAITDAKDALDILRRQAASGLLPREDYDELLGKHEAYLQNAEAKWESVVPQLRETLSKAEEEVSKAYYELCLYEGKVHEEASHTVQNSTPAPRASDAQSISTQQTERVNNAYQHNVRRSLYDRLQGLSLFDESWATCSTWYRDYIMGYHGYCGDPQEPQHSDMKQTLERKLSELSQSHPEWGECHRWFKTNYIEMPAQAADEVCEGAIPLDASVIDAIRYFETNSIEMPAQAADESTAPQSSTQSNDSLASCVQLSTEGTVQGEGLFANTMLKDRSEFLLPLWIETIPSEDGMTCDTRVNKWEEEGFWPFPLQLSGAERVWCNGEVKDASTVTLTNGNHNGAMSLISNGPLPLPSPFVVCHADHV